MRNYVPAALVLTTPQVWSFFFFLQFKGWCTAFLLHFKEWLNRVLIKIQPPFLSTVHPVFNPAATPLLPLFKNHFLKQRQGKLQCRVTQDTISPFPGELAPLEKNEWKKEKKKGCDKLALGGNAKQRFWQQATWNPCKTATCIVSRLYSFHLGGTREERKAGRHVNTVNTRWVMSWKN